MKQFLRYSFAVFIIFCKGLLAQQKPVNELDNLYTPPDNSVFDGNGNTAAAVASRDPSETTLAVKFNPTLLIRQAAAIWSEYRISERMSLSGGLGYCYRKDPVLAGVSALGMDFDSDSKSALSLGEIMQEGIYRPGTNIFLSFASRVYNNDYYDHHFYYEMGARFYVNTLQISGSTSKLQYPVKDEPVTKIKSWVFSTVYGIQFISSGKIQTVHDFYLGGGFRSTSFNIFDREEINTMVNGYPARNYVYVMSGLRDHALTPVIMAGYALGFSF